MQFSLKLVKITAYARPRKQNVLHYKTFSGAPQGNTSEISTANPKITSTGKLIVNVNVNVVYSGHALSFEIASLQACH